MRERMDKIEDRMIVKIFKLKGEFIGVDTCCYLVSSFFLCSQWFSSFSQEWSREILLGDFVDLHFLVCYQLLVVSSLVALIFCLGILQANFVLGISFSSWEQDKILLSCLHVVLVRLWRPKPSSDSLGLIISFSYLVTGKRGKKKKGREKEWLTVVAPYMLARFFV